MIGYPEFAPAGHDVEQLLTRVERLAVRLVSDSLRGRPDDDVHEDIAQACRMHLWRYSLRRYDPAKGDLLPFVTACVKQVIARELARIDRAPSVFPLQPDEDDAEANEALAREDQPDVHHLAQQVIEEPERFLTPKQARIFRLVLAGGHPRTIATVLGIAPASVSKAIWRIRKRLVEIVGDLPLTH